MFKLLRRHDKVQTGLKRSRESWLARVTQIGQRSRLDDALWEELEELLISADVGVATTAQIIERVREEASAHRLTDSSDAIELLKQEMVSLLSPKDTAIDNGQLPVSGGPMVILAMGVNGVGKTTSVAKLAHYFKEQGNRVLLAASDTFRAAAIDQLQAWGQLVGVDVIAHNPGGDPAAIAYDALEAARARGANVVLVDTAGRLHTKLNLMEEMKKISRVLSRLDPEAPHEALLILDATTGQNGLAQARSFTEAVGCTGVFLAKLDGTARAGIVVAIVQELGLPVLFIGTGEAVQDMAPFDPREFVEELFSPLD
ncbi:MAG: signal recognition particle-docking protein FtsY [Dehalococcoidia bacterium]|jgi:fused signal recognition particle receptor|nr:signal recognition particle-docking protein FtsY [Dehalococcoidia bacterium]